MAHTHLLDTSVFSQPIKDRPVETVLSRWDGLGDQAVCTSALCLAELREGLEIRQSRKYWRRFNELLENRYLILPFDESTAATYARLSAELRSLGKPKPTVDLLVAAVAKQHGLILATLNAIDFASIPGLAVESWA